jgi:hypothetical protein
VFKRLLFLILMFGVLLCLPGCDDDDNKCLCPELTYDTTIVGDWSCIYREGDFIGGEDQDQLFITFNRDSTYGLMEIEFGDPPDTSTDTGTYDLANDTLTITSNNPIPVIKFECFIDGNRMDWTLGGQLWVFVREIPE